MEDIRMSIVYRNGLAAALPFDPPFAPPTLSKLFLPVTCQSRLLPRETAPAAPTPSLSERLVVAARRAWVNYRREADAGYHMSQAILRDCGGRRDFTKPRWVGQLMRRGQALERLVADGFVTPGMTLWFSNAPGSDPNRLDPRCGHMFYTCIGLDSRGLPIFAGAEGAECDYETVTARLRLLGLALDKAFPFTAL